MDAPLIIAAVTVCFASLYFLRLAISLAKLGLTEYSGGADFIRRSLGPMAGSAAVAVGGASFIAFPSWPSGISQVVATYFPPETVDLLTKFGPILGLMLGLGLLMGLLRVT